MLHPARNLGLAQEHLSATQGRRNRAQPSCSPCRHFSTCHPGAPLPEPFGQRDPPALPAQSASGRLLEPLLGASSLGQRRAQHPRRQSSLRGERGERRFNRRQISSVDVSSPKKEQTQQFLTRCGQLSSQAPDFQHGFVPEPILLTELTGAPGIFTGPHCSWEWTDRRS